MGYFYDRKVIAEFLFIPCMLWEGPNFLTGHSTSHYFPICDCF